MTIAQAAALAAIPKSPYYFDPYRYRDNLVGNWQISLDGGLPTPINQDQYGHLFANILQQLHYPSIQTGQDLIALLPTFSGHTLDASGVNHYRFINYSPGRKDYVIQRMVEDIKITPQQALEAIVTPLVFTPESNQINTIKNPHFVYYIKESILNNPSLHIDEQQLSQ